MKDWGFTSSRMPAFVVDCSASPLRFYCIWMRPRAYSFHSPIPLLKNKPWFQRHLLWVLMDVFVLFTSGLWARFLKRSQLWYIIVLYNGRLKRNALRLPLNFEHRLIKRESGKGSLASRPAKGIFSMNYTIKILHPIPCVLPSVKV